MNRKTERMKQCMENYFHERITLKKGNIQIAKEYGISPSTLYKALDEIAKKYGKTREIFLDRHFTIGSRNRYKEILNGNVSYSDEIQKAKDLCDEVTMLRVAILELVGNT